MIAPLGSAAVPTGPDEIVQAMVVIQNKNIGHSLIPEVRDLYEPWVEFLVQDAGGKEIYHSGFLKADGIVGCAGAQLHQPARECGWRVCG